MAEARYRKVEFTSDLAVVWERVRAGWDWLGVTDEGELVLGYPGHAPPVSAPPDVTITSPGAREGAHGVRVAGALGRTTSSWYATEARAAEEYARAVQDLRVAGGAPRTLTLVQRIEDGAVVDETVVASGR